LTLLKRELGKSGKGALTPDPKNPQRPMGPFCVKISGKSKPPDFQKTVKGSAVVV
jgi:hypothetical protein